MPSSIKFSFRNAIDYFLSEDLNVLLPQLYSNSIVILICTNCPSIVEVDYIEEHLASREVKFLFLRPDELTALYLVLVALQDLRQLQRESFNKLLIYGIDGLFIDSVPSVKLLSLLALQEATLVGPNENKAQKTLNKLIKRKMSGLY